MNQSNVFIKPILLICVHLPSRTPFGPLSTGLAGAFDRPFGGTLYITGEIPAALALNTADTLKYKVYVRQLPGGPWQPLTNSFGITVHEGTGIGTAVSHSITQSIDPAGWYTYREHGTPVTGNWRRVSSPNRLLAAWHTAKPMAGLWEIRIEALDTATNTVHLAGVTTCSDSSTRQNVKVRLDESVPVPSITLRMTDTGWVKEVAPLIKESLDAIGIDTTRDISQSASMYEKVDSGDYTVAIAPGDPSEFGVDPDLLMNWWYGENVWTQTRTAWADSPEYAELRTLLSDLEERSDRPHRSEEGDEAATG